MPPVHPWSTSWLGPIPGPSQTSGLSRTSSSLPCAALGVFRDLVHVGLVDEAGTGEHRLPAAERVGVLHVQLEHHDRQVTLLVLLLVDGELDLTRDRKSVV